MKFGERQSVEKQLAREIAAIETRLEEMSSANDTKSRYVVAYLKDLLRRRRDRLKAITMVEDRGNR